MSRTRRFRFAATPIGVLIWAAIMNAVAVGAGDVPYGVADKPWDVRFGNHRARIQVTAPAEAVRVRLPWRRRDHDAARKNIIVVDAASGEPVRNVVRVAVNREFADLVFQPKTAPGEYYAYYLPYVVPKHNGYYEDGYPPVANTADAAWTERNRLTAAALSEGHWRKLPEAAVLEFQARTAFDSFDPMEIVATAAELKSLLAAHAADTFLLFPEDRRWPIRMTDDLPKRWIDRGPGRTFSGEARRNEFYTWQIGLWAATQPLEDLKVEFSDLRPAGLGKAISASALRCFNLGGRDIDGHAFAKRLDVARGKVQALWIGVDVPPDVEPGRYRGTVMIRPQNARAAEVELLLTIRPQSLADRGDGELWRHSRLRWLDSTLGIDDEVAQPYTPLVVEGRTVRCLGREVRIGDDGLPQEIRSGPQDILARPMRLAVETEAGPLALAGGSPQITKQTPGAVVWQSQSAGGPVSLGCQATMEFDGHLQYRLVVRANEAVKLKDIRLEMPLRPEAATYMMGIGRPGGYRPAAEYAWKWTGSYNSFWLGDVHAGLHCVLRGATYCGPMLDLYHPAPPPSWHNGGRGGCTIGPADASQVPVRAYSGARTLAAGQEMAFEFSLLITPVKPLDTARHFGDRYVHSFPPPPAAELAAAKVNVVNLHHGNEVNPYINYPFLTVPQISAFTRAWHAHGEKVKIYYTVRELSNHAAELWALRSLGTEVLAPRGVDSYWWLGDAEFRKRLAFGGGFPWLREHMADGYTAAWLQPFAEGPVDAALLTSPESRWCNYYVEGVGWLAKNAEIDGLYLDAASYDRRTIQRARKVLQRTRPECRIDLHAANVSAIGPANQYAEFLPYVDRLFFGECFDYNGMTPEAWLVGASGIPFGLMGDMLEDASWQKSNPWRGMIYGMTNRFYAATDPRPIWKLCDEFGIVGARMIGYWEKDCPVRTDNKDVLATAYVRGGQTLVSIASWSPQPVDVNLAIDRKALGLDPQKAEFVAPEVSGFQSAGRWPPSGTIPVAPGKGWLLLIRQRG